MAHATVPKFDPRQSLTKEQVAELGKDLGIKNWRSFDSDW
jgi:hypothetical protein